MDLEIRKRLLKAYALGIDFMEANNKGKQKTGKRLKCVIAESTYGLVK